MSGVIEKKLCLALILFVAGLIFTQKANAASLSSVSDTITTSRPSASTPLATDQVANVTQVTIFDNGSYFLASDSAVLWPDTGETLNTVNVASMSATNIPSSGRRIIYFTNTAANTHHQGDPITVAVTATHTIKFTTSSSIPANGHIVIQLPGTVSQSASPSATTFPLNGLTSANASTYIQTNNANTCTWTVSTSGTPTFDCQTNNSIVGGTTVTVIIGCTAQSGGTCTTFAPRLINPTKTAAAGTADQWKITVKTQDNNSVDLDTSKAVAATVEAVQVQGTVDAYITFSIAGVANNTSVCSGADTTNPGAGLNSTATFVNLGNLVNAAINISAQTLTVSTNGAGGYTIAATSSGRFINPASGFWIPDANGGNGLTAVDTPAPAVFPASSGTAAAFGIHPCGTDVNTSTWASGATAFNSGAKYSNPWNTGTNGYYANIASYTAPSSSRATTVEYAGTVGLTTPAGIYSNYFTYVATPIF